MANNNAAHTASSSALKIVSLSHFYGDFKALNDIDLVIEKGQFVVLLGPNGAGKTTLFSLITRLYNYQYGDIFINNHQLQKNPYKALNSLGVVFQQRSLDIDLTVNQNLQYSGALYGLNKKQAHELAQLELERLDMLDFGHVKIRTLSGGQARRVEIARALMTKPSMLILDEPTVGLDINSRTNLLAHVRELAKTTNTAVLWTTHLIDEIDQQDYLIILKKGQIVSRAHASDFTNLKDQLHEALQ